MWFNTWVVLKQFVLQLRLKKGGGRWGVHRLSPFSARRIPSVRNRNRKLDSKYATLSTFQRYDLRDDPHI